MPKVLLLAWDRVSKIKVAFGNKQYKPKDIQELFHKLFNDVQKIHEELAEYINTPSLNHPTFYNNDEDDDEEFSIPMSEIYKSSLTAITPDLLIMDSLIMEDEHRDIISEIKLDKLIKSSVENIVPNPSESKSLSEDLSDIESECDVPVCDDFTTFSNSLFDADEKFSSSDDESFSDEDVPKEIYSTLFYSLIISSPKIDSLLEEFSGELAHIDSIPSRINEADFDPEEEIHLDSDSLMDEIDLFLTSDDSMPSSIENDDYDSEGDILFLEEFFSNASLSLPKNESFQFYVPSSPRPPAKSSDDEIYFEPDTRVLNVKVVGDISEHYVLMPRLLPTQPTLASNEEKSPHLLSHRGFKAYQLSSESTMMIYEGNVPILEVPFLYFYPF
nr:hypothetical protein [Tanacetum cinerariifolium]